MSFYSITIGQYAWLRFSPFNLASFIFQFGWTFSSVFVCVCVSVLHSFERWPSCVRKPTTFAFSHFQSTAAFSFCLFSLPLSLALAQLLDHFHFHFLFPIVTMRAKNLLLCIQVASNNSVKWVFTRFAWLQSHYKSSLALSFGYILWHFCGKVEPALFESLISI